MKLLAATTTLVLIATPIFTTSAIAQSQCEPDRYGNIIDLGDGNCATINHPQPSIEEIRPTTNTIPPFTAQQAPPSEQIPHPFKVLFDNPHVLKAYMERVEPQLIDSYYFWAIEDRWLFRMDVGLNLINPGSNWGFVDCQTSWGFEYTEIKSSIPGGTPTRIVEYEFPKSYSVAYIYSFSESSGRDRISTSQVIGDSEIDRRDVCRYMGLEPDF